MCMWMKAGVVALAGVMFSGAANAALITNSGDPALVGGTTINFDATPTQNAVSFTFGNVTFSTNGGTLRIASASEGGTFGGSGQDLSTRDTTSPSSLSIEFATPVSAFGMIWGAANPNWTVDLFDQSNALIETLIFIGGNSTASFVEFYGASGSGISRAELVTTSGFDWVKIDNFVFVEELVDVPEPSTTAILALALGLLALAAGARRSLRDDAEA